MNEMNNGENNNQNIEQPNLNENQNMVQPEQQYVQPIQEQQPVSEPSKKSHVLVIILIILVIGLVGFIVYDKVIKKEEPVKQDEKTEPAKEEIFDKFYDTYDENSIILAGIENNGYMYAVESISGLKDKSVQKIINDKIKDYGEKTYDDLEIKGAKNIVNCHLTPYANFNNLLSLKATSNDSHCNSLNLDLNTGEILKIEDLFISNTDIEKIILSTGIRIIYNEDDEFEEPKTLVGITEEKLIEEIKNKKYDFYFDNLAVYIETESGETIRISIADNIDNFAYFDKYKGDDIFEDNSIGKKGLSINAKDDFITKLSKNAYIDVISWETFTSSPAEVRKALVEYLENKVKNDNDGSMKIITGNLDLSHKFYQNSKSTMEVLASYPKLVICKATRDYIHSKEFKTMVVESRFSELGMGGDYLLLEDLNCEKLPNFAIYYTDNSYKVYENVKDIFVNNFDVDKYLKENIYDKAFTIDYTQEEAKEIFTDSSNINYELEYYLTSYGIQLKGYELGDNNKIRSYDSRWFFNKNTNVYNYLRIFDDLNFEK